MLKKILTCYQLALIDTINHNGVEQAGYISFLLMLAIFPFLIFIGFAISTINSMYENIGHSIINLLTSLFIDSDFANLIVALQPRILEIISTPPQSFLGIATISVIWTASSLLEGLRTILNLAYRVSNPPSYLLRRMMSILQFILIVVIVITVSVILKCLPIILYGILSLVRDQNSFIEILVNVILQLHDIISSIIFFIISFLFLSYIYYLIPNTKNKFIQTFPGTFNTIIFWQLSTKAFQYYLLFFQQINIVYGSIAGIIIALLYFYICSLIFIYGAELNYWVITIRNNANI